MTDLLATPADWPRILLAHADAADPLDLDAAVAAGAFVALRRAVRDLGGTAVTAIIAASGLRGRGGAGYPAGEKWRAAAATEAPRRYVVANGYGADPASHTDRTLLARDPFAVIEGIAIAALAIGASEAFIALRAEDSDLISAVSAAVGSATEAGFLGPDVLGSGHDVYLTVRPVQGAYMLGEETVLLKALESKRGQPEQRPPYPATEGLLGMPTLVHNVQTLAAVPWIIREGADAFRAIGSSDAPGTVLVQVRGPGGDGIAEVPLGTPLRDVIGLGGAMPAGRSVQAVLVGGPSGGLLPPDALDTPYTFATLRASGAHVGSGSVVVIDDRTDLVELVGVLTRFCANEACGKTIPCRIGTKRLAELVGRREGGLIRPSDARLATDLAADIVASALCDHERLATLPLTTGMRYFESEFAPASRPQPAATEAPR
ncbi:MAG TPA: NADH-ubiquinone oxidoreductase-F iron-sulfur binding region domain-containing protein [Candidatus Saccharimonadales bacterium]|nr:NADH-ubiquinone oxidoreductase-F iron-sulfur binding region domain-containing protein [Candidatus Saccharimonadales bacterium]